MTLDLNLYRGLFDDKIFYIDAKTPDNIDIQIYISFYNLVVIPNPVTFGMNVSFSYKKLGGFINYTCDNITYDNIDNNDYSIILLCDKVSGGVFNQDNINKSYLVVDNNSITYVHALENLINSNFYFQINNSLISFNGNLFQTNLGNINEYITNIVNKKILSLEGNNVYNILNKINYSVLNITNAPLFTYKVVNDVIQNKIYEIEIQFIGTDINSLNKNTLNLLINDILSTLFYELDLVFYPTLISNQPTTLDNNLPTKLSSNLNNSIFPSNTDGTTFNASTVLKNICVPSGQTVSFPIYNTNNSLGYAVNNVFIGSGGTLNITNNTGMSVDNFEFNIQNGLNNNGTINFDGNIELGGGVLNFSNVCNGFDTTKYWVNDGFINLEGNIISCLGVNFINNGTINGSNLCPP